MSDSEKYARWVLDPKNSVKTGRLIKLAAERFLKDLTREDIYFDEEKAVLGVNFIERYCRQWEGEWRGQPLMLELWQKFIFEQLRGWIVKATGHRRFNRVYMQVSKKNGKSSMCAGLGLDHIYADEEINTPKVFVAANNEEQAKICVNMAGRMVEQSPDLYEYVSDGEVRLFKYKDNITEVVHAGRDGFIKPMSKETSDKTSKTAGGKHGQNPSMGLVDEFGMSPDYGASEAIESGMASRLQYLMAFFTTSGFNLTGPCYLELRGMGIQVLEGTIEMDNYLPIIFEIDPPLDENGHTKEITAQWLYDHPEVWGQSNPNLGISVNPSFLKQQLEKAIQRRGTVEVGVKTLNFNVWCESVEVWIPTEIWGKNTHGIKEEELLGRECYGGIEIISAAMMNCFCLIFPDVNGVNVVKPIFWMPEDFKTDNDQFQDWIEKGFIHTTPGDIAENTFAYDVIQKEISKYYMHSFAYKTNLANHDIVQSLIRNGITGNPISHGYQGISTPTVLWEEMASRSEIEHFGNPVLNWMNSNCMVKRKDNDIRLEKSGSKVVGIYAGINALAQFKTITANDMGYQKIEQW